MTPGSIKTFHEGTEVTMAQSQTQSLTLTHDTTSKQFKISPNKFKTLSKNHQQTPHKNYSQNNDPYNKQQNLHAAEKKR